MLRRLVDLHCFHRLLRLPTRRTPEIQPHPVVTRQPRCLIHQQAQASVLSPGAQNAQPILIHFVYTIFAASTMQCMRSVFRTALLRDRWQSPRMDERGLVKVTHVRRATRNKELAMAFA